MKRQVQRQTSDDAALRAYEAEYRALGATEADAALLAVTEFNVDEAIDLVALYETLLDHGA